MTTLNDVYARPDDQSSGVPEVDVFGVAWPLYKLHAVLVGVVAAVLALALGGAPVVAAWIAGGSVLAVWWGERIWSSRRCDHGVREHAPRN
ncbi:MAG: hypothetical protein QM658_04885 [Gordonia sp. (in: high G+C Gram-positive bacteria)]